MATIGKFERSLPQLLSIGDYQATLWRSLMQSLIDNGASTEHLDDFLRDCAMGHLSLNEFVRNNIMGPIWQRVGKICDLGEIDYSEPLRSFAERHTQLYVPYQLSQSRSSWTGTKPVKPCGYTLVHFEKAMSFNGIVTDDFSRFHTCGKKLEHAGIRELITYASLMPGDDFCRCKIIAGGSIGSISLSAGISTNCLPVSCCDKATSGQQVAQIYWCSVVDGKKDALDFDLTHFYLVRVYDE